MRAAPWIGATLGVVLALAGCGGGAGGGGSTGGPPPPPPVSSAEAQRFLWQTSFGPTDADVQRVVQQGYAGWIDAQMAQPATHELAYMNTLPQPNTTDDRVDAWFQAALKGNDQLRQRVAFALSELFVVSEVSGLNRYPQALAWYYDLLADDAFVNFRTLMEDVTLSPEMGLYLNMLGNRRADPAHNIRPDENYARELMQLFTIGLVQLAPDGTVMRDPGGVPLPSYNQAVVEGFSRAYTGWTFAGTPDFTTLTFDWFHPMVAVEALHEPGTKQLLRGSVLAAGGTARSDLTAALDNIFQHSNVGPFVARSLIQRLVASNPSPAYVGRIAAVFNDNGHGTRGDLAAVVRALLLDPEARDAPASSTSGKLKEPLVRVTGLWRLYGSHAANGRYALPGVEFLLGQAPLRSPSVFNFFRPDYAPAGELASAGLVAPELQINTELTESLTADVFSTAVYQNNTFNGTPAPGDVMTDFSAELPYAGDPSQLVTRMATRLLGGTISPALRTAAEGLAGQYPAGQESVRVLEVAWLLLSSDEYALQR
ncbi:MAG: hypothetical protein RL684_2431 [Pseudomonadota bacterium]